VKKILDTKYIVEIGKEETTHGININEWKTPCYVPLLEEYPQYEYSYDFQLPEKVFNSRYFEEDSEDGPDDYDIDNWPYFIKRTIGVRIWDFGGQDIYLTTHQFFLTKRSIYVLVWDARKEEEYESFEYWLNTIKILGRNSHVLIVMNKVDVRSTSIDELALKKSFPNIIDFYKVSCVTQQGISEFIRDLSLTINKLSHLKDRIPSSWVDIKHELNEIEENFISQKRFQNICIRNKIYGKQIEVFSDYLHDLGLFLHFRSDPILENIIILNPSWVTKAVYSLIDSKEISENKGKFNFKSLSKAWSSELYPSEKYHELLRLLEKFELCFNMVGTPNYVLPELLPQNLEHEFQKKNNDGTVLRFTYTYEFMPAGIITRFICRTHNWIHDDYFWYNGVVLKYENSFSEITQNKLKKRIDIVISGEECAEFLPIIRSHFDEIHKSINIACTQLQGMHMSINSKEDDRNGFVANILNNRGVFAKDQTRWGRSATGKSQGELDIKIEDKIGTSLGIFEGFNLAYLNKTIINNHFDKIFKYDSNGLKENYLVVYSESKDFPELWNKYFKHISEYKGNYNKVSVTDITKNHSYGSEIKIAKFEYERSNSIGCIYHILLNLNI